MNSPLFTLQTSGFSSAVFSDHYKYRYVLTRQVTRSHSSHSGRVMFIMLNPSTADANNDDATIRRCIDFAWRWGVRRLAVTNLSPFRSSYPKELRHAGPEPENIEEANRLAILNYAGDSHMVVAAWGSDGSLEGRSAKVLEWLKPITKVYCLGVTKRGEPLHPLYLPRHTRPYVFQQQEAPME